MNDSALLPPIPNPYLRAHPVQPLTEAAFLLEGLGLALKLPVDQHDRNAGEHMRGIGAQFGHDPVAVGWHG